METRSDSNGYGTRQPDTERSHAAQDGPSTNLGDATNRAVGSPASEDLQSQIAAEGKTPDQKAKKEEVDEIESDGNSGFPEGK